MTTINLRDFYYWYTHDEFIEVDDEVAAELYKGRREQKIHEQRIRRNKSYYSLDANDGIEIAAIVLSTDNPKAVVDIIERHCRLCRALNSLPEKQGRRIEAHFIIGKSRKEIARSESVSESSVNESIERGIKAMKKYLMKIQDSPVECPRSEADI